MKHATTIIMVIGVLLIAVAIGSAQTVITASQAANAYVGKMRINKYDSTTQTFNFGGTGSGQSWNFSSIDTHRTSVSRETTNVYPAAGHVGADHFPTATACQTAKFKIAATNDTVFSQDFAFYIHIQTDGGYALGQAIRLFWSPARPNYPPWNFYPSDTTFFQVNHPMQLGIPFPLQNDGSTRTSLDTIDESNPFNPLVRQKSIQNATFTLTGEGTIVLPGGTTPVACVRLIEDRIRFDYRNDTLVDRQRTKRITFFTPDFIQFSLDVDTNWTSGNAKAENWSLEVTAGPATAVHQTSDAVPTQFNLEQNYPNPFNPSTTIKFDIQKEGAVSLKVYNMVGQEVATLANGRFAPGSYNVTFDAAGLPSGVYIYRLTANGMIQSKSMLLVK